MRHLPKRHEWLIQSSQRKQRKAASVPLCKWIIDLYLGHIDTTGYSINISPGGSAASRLSQAQIEFLFWYYLLKQAQPKSDFGSFGCPAGLCTACGFEAPQLRRLSKPGRRFIFSGFYMFLLKSEKTRFEARKSSTLLIGRIRIRATMIFGIEYSEAFLVGLLSTGLAVCIIDCACCCSASL